MKYKSIASISSILILINAILYLVAPTFSISLLEGSLTPAGIFNTRISGACALGLSLILWQSRDLPRSPIRSVISKSLMVTCFILIIIDIHALLTGSVNKIGLIILLADFLMGIAFLFSLNTGTVDE